MSTPTARSRSSPARRPASAKASAVALLRLATRGLCRRRQAEEAAVASAGEDASRGLAVVTDVSNRRRSRRCSTKRWPASAAWM